MKRLRVRTDELNTAPVGGELHGSKERVSAVLTPYVRSGAGVLTFMSRGRVWAVGRGRIFCNHDGYEVGK